MPLARGTLTATPDLIPNLMLQTHFPFACGLNKPGRQDSIHKFGRRIW